MAHDPDQLIGTTLGDRYRILRDLGEESLGHVFVAQDLGEGDRLVQIKVISPSIGADEETFARFGREISASFMVSHPNTVEVFDYGQQGELRYLVSEFLAARPLAEVLQGGVLSVERAALIGAQVAAAVAAAHQEGIVHRALSPETVLLLENSRDGDYIKVRDFGLSKLSDEDDGDVTRADVRVGSPAYMAPEYIDEGIFDPKGDLYALGCLLFELVSGQPPYVGDPSTILRLQVEGDPPRLSAKVPGVPGWFDELVADLLSKEPGARPGSHQVAQRVAGGLGRVLHPPQLWPLDAEGRVIRPEEAREPGLPVGRVVGIVAVALLGVVTLVLILIASVATIVLLLTNLPS
ncbi:MAG TPA: serine/threonine protein kinase [Deltaproteobacteria bacterium]|nr:serine/threonine protein kinase [Deltaproteobacteria bacterium]